MYIKHHLNIEILYKVFYFINLNKEFVGQLKFEIDMSLELCNIYIYIYMHA